MVRSKRRLHSFVRASVMLASQARKHAQRQEYCTREDTYIDPRGCQVTFIRAWPRVTDELLSPARLHRNVSKPIPGTMIRTSGHHIRYILLIGTDRRQNGNALSGLFRGSQEVSRVLDISPDVPFDQHGYGGGSSDDGVGVRGSHIGSCKARTTKSVIRSLKPIFFTKHSSS